MPTPKLITLANLGPEGTFPQDGLVEDAAGNLFGGTEGGGIGNHGMIFEVVRTADGYDSTPNILVNFNGADGSAVMSGLIMDAAGNLFGTTYGGGAYYSFGGEFGGTVFEIPRTADGYASTPTTLASFKGDDGRNLHGALMTDANGDLFSTTEYGGANNLGTVFEIVKAADGYDSTPKTLVTFNGTNGANPQGYLVADDAGNLFSTTRYGGANGAGTVFEIMKTADGYASTPITLLSFNGTDGANPYAALLIDAAGDLFGSTFLGGANGLGTVFEIAKTDGGYDSTPAVLGDFDYNIGSPIGGLIADAAGNLFGASFAVYEIPRNADGSFGALTTVVNLDAWSFGDLTADAAGNLFGTDHQASTVFEVTNSGFQVSCFLNGTRIATEFGEARVEELRAGDRVRCQMRGVAPIVWVGWRQLDVRRHADPTRVWPVRVRNGAFAAGMPGRDLFLSPDHAVFLDGVLIPIRCLINGGTIAQVPMDAVSYYHIELAEHDVLSADGLPVESYLDTGDRANFANGGGAMTLHPDFTARMWEAKACAPLVVIGREVAAARLRLAEQAHGLPDDTRGPAAYDRFARSLHKSR